MVLMIDFIQSGDRNKKLKKTKNKKQLQALMGLNPFCPSVRALVVSGRDFVSEHSWALDP